LITLGPSSRQVLYFGDSNMQQYYPRIEKVLADHPLNSRGAVFAVRDWCAPIESDIPGSDGATSPVCRAFAHNALEYAKGPGVDTVVIGACWRCYFLSFDDPLAHSGTCQSL
jgi:SGNH domain (fused to AT3 domains)